MSMAEETTTARPYDKTPLIQLRFNVTKPEILEPKIGKENFKIKNGMIRSHRLIVTLVGLPSLIVTRAKKAESKSQVYLALFIVT
jgi:hypothetical protein